MGDNLDMNDALDIKVIEDNFTQYIAKNEEDKTAREIELITKKLGDRHIDYMDGVPLHIPRLVPPTLDKQPSIATSAAINLYIDDIADSAHIQNVIDIINNYLRRVNLLWKITPQTIEGKLHNNRKYLANTLYGIWHLEDGANLAMLRSLKKHEDKADSNTVIIDYSNLKFGLKYDCEPAKFPGVDLADEINNWTMETMGDCKIIIISIQENDRETTEFKEFMNRLKDIFGSQSIVIIVGSDASSYDDLNIAYIVTQLLPKSKKYIISSDKFRDLYRINTLDKTVSPIFKNSEQLQMITIDTFCQPPNYRYKPSRVEPSRRIPVSRTDRKKLASPYARRGGTNKNKKSLLNKYTRKLKKLHKKRILSKKVVKKYSKNYKNKTLKRKH
jgi:hypothetical protein